MLQQVGVLVDSWLADLTISGLLSYMAVDRRAPTNAGVADRRRLTEDGNGSVERIVGHDTACRGHRIHGMFSGDSRVPPLGSQ